ncbi:MAG TPA: DivIVA domain-containing protein [Firmicutes bacterium]|nr:DivIVA domain-containing protein [Bacillota bacterium]
MTITPLDIENTRFRGSLGGYNRNEVDVLLAKVAQELEARLTQIEELQRKIAQLEQTVATYRESEELLKNSVVLAQRTSDEIIAAAHQHADAIVREAESSGRETTRRLGELRAEREQFEYAFHGLLAGFLHRLEQGNPELGERRRPAPELQAPQSSNAAESMREPASHSRQLLSEAAGAGGVQDASAGPWAPPEQTASPGGGHTAPQSEQPSKQPDDFEQAIEAARPVPRDEWPGSSQAEAPELSAAPSAGEVAPGEPPELSGVGPIRDDEPWPPPAEDEAATLEDPEEPDDRLPLD